jgi:hypothetical protein
MDLDDFMITVFCGVDEAIPEVLDGQRLRQRGPAPTLCASEVVTMEIVGEYLGLEQEQALFAYVRHHYAHCFPAVRQIHRTTVVRQAATICGASKNGCGSDYLGRCRTTRPLPLWIASHCPSASSRGRIAVGVFAARRRSARIR